MKLIRMPTDEMIPTERDDYIEVGFTELLDNLSKGALTPTIFKGPKGCGKTLALEQWCAQHGIPMVRENCTSGTDKSDLIGTFSMRGANEVVFCLGALPTAIEIANEAGMCVLVLEEVNALRPNVQSTIYSVADYRRSVEASSLGKNFRLKDGAQLWVLGTMNPGYSGTYQLSEALRSRFVFIEVLYMAEAREKELLEATFETPPDVEERRIAARLLQFAAESRTYDWDYALSTRDLEDVVRCYSCVGLEKALKILVGKFDPEHKGSIEARIQSLFAINLNEVALYEV